MPPFLVINPHSDRGRTGRRLPAILRTLRASLGRFDYALTTGPLDAERLTRQAIAGGARNLIAVGGDGTCNEVLNGFFENDAPLALDAVLGVLPCGTGSDLGRTFGWSARLDASVARLQGTTSRRIDLGCIAFDPYEGKPSRRYFLNSASMGVSSKIVNTTQRTRSWLPGKLAYALATVREMRHHRDHPLRFSLDGGPTREVDATVLAVANGQYFGGGIRVAPDAQMDDGLFDLTLWSGYGFGDLLFKAPAVYSGRHVHFAKTHRYQARTVRIESSEPVLIEVDGEQLGRLPATIRIVPGALRLQGG